MEIKVNNCNDCPMLNIDSEFGSLCKHPNAEKDPPIHEYDYMPNGLPEKCPLKQGETTIKL